MKKFSSTKQKEQLNIQDNTINYISVEDLQKYLEVANKFISDDAKDVVNWLILHNETYLNDLDPSASADNALEFFYNQGLPKDGDLKSLYQAITRINRNNRLLEIPVFQTKEQFNDIIKKKISPDEILMDLTSEESRNKIAKQYIPLIHKIIRQWFNKSTLGYDDLISIAYMGLTYAMNTFGKRKARDENGHWVEIEKEENDKTASYTFTQYAAYCINNSIKEEIKHNSHLVRVPASQQKKERNEKGYNTRSFTVSGSKKVGNDKDGNSKSLFDFIDNGDNGHQAINNSDLDKLWKYVYTKLDETFKKRDLEIFYSLFGLNGYEKVKGKELAKKYNIGETTITAVKNKFISYIKKDKNLWLAFNEILSIVGESKTNKYNVEDQYLEEHQYANKLRTYKYIE